MCGAKLHRTRRPLTYYREECHAKIFCEAFQNFKHFFKSKTGIHWDQRLDGLPADPEKFKYNAPTEGRPVGLLPFEWEPPKREENEMTNDSDDGLVYDTDSEGKD